jgi:hypothetical protein
MCMHTGNTFAHSLQVKSKQNVICSTQRKIIKHRQVGTKFMAVMLNIIVI